jgi:hypothetical protein
MTEEFNELDFPKKKIEIKPIITKNLKLILSK